MKFITMSHRLALRWRANLALCSLLLAFIGCGKISSDEPEGDGDESVGDGDDESSNDEPSDEDDDSLDEDTPYDEDDCENPVFSCELGGGNRMCFSESSYYPLYEWPPLVVVNEGGAGGQTSEEPPFCPPPEALITYDFCSEEVVEVCSEAERVGDDCCYDVIIGQRESCCG